MEGTSPSLGDQLAGLRHSAQARPENCALLPAAIHALIAAIFAKVFARLEQLLALWQAGTLPAPRPVCRRPGQAVRALMLRRGPQPDYRVRTAPAAPRDNLPATTSATARPAAPRPIFALFGMAPHRPIPAAPRSRRHPARDPPAGHASHQSPNPALRRRTTAPLFISILNCPTAPPSIRVADGVTSGRSLR